MNFTIRHLQNKRLTFICVYMFNSSMKSIQRGIQPQREFTLIGVNYSHAHKLGAPSVRKKLIDSLPNSFFEVQHSAVNSAQLRVDHGYKSVKWERSLDNITTRVSQWRPRWSLACASFTVWGFDWTSFTVWVLTCASFTVRGLAYASFNAWGRASLPLVHRVRPRLRPVPRAKPRSFPSEDSLAPR